MLKLIKVTSSNINIKSCPLDNLVLLIFVGLYCSLDEFPHDPKLETPKMKNFLPIN